MPLNKPVDSGRIYPTKVLQKAIAKIQGPVKEGTFLGRFVDDGHIPEGRPSLADAAMVVRSVSIEGDLVVGSFETLNTPRGRMLEQIIRSDKIMFRPMGTGKVGPDGKVTEYQIDGIAAIHR